MFEVEGRQVTLQDLQDQAKRQGLDFDVYYDKLKSQKNVVDLGELSKIKPEDPELTPWDNFKNNMYNAFEMSADVFEYWGISQEEDTVEEATEKGTLGAYSGLDIATAIVWEAVLGRENMKKYKEEFPSLFKTYSPTDSRAFQEVIKNFEKEKEQTKETMTFAQADSFADYLSVISGSILNVGGSVVYNLGTLGSGFFMEFASDNFIQANKIKAESQGKSLEQLLKDGEADSESAIKIASLQAGLEYVGVSKIVGRSGVGKKLNKKVGEYLTKNYKKSKNIRAGLDILGTGRVEAFTEMGQTGLEIYNKELAQSKADGEEINDLLSITRGMFSAEGIEAGLQGFFGGGGLKAGSYSAKSLNAVRQTDKTLDVETELSQLSDLSKKLNQTTDKDVRSSISGQIQELESEIKSKIKKGNDLYQSLSDGDIKKIESLTDLADVSAYRANQLIEKRKQGIITKSEFEIAIKGLSEKYKQNKQAIKDILLEKNIEFARVEGEELGLNVVELEDDTAAQQQYDDLQEQGKVKKSLNVKGADGFIVGNDIYINKAVARESGAISVGSHELLHGVIGNSFQDLDSNKRKKLSKSFYKTLNTEQQAYVKSRIENAYNVELNDEFFESSTAEELFTVFSDGIAKNEISFNDTLFQKIGQSIQQFLNNYIPGYRKEFSNGRQVYDFLKDYEKSRKVGKLSDRAKAFKQDQASDAVKKSMTAVEKANAEAEVKKLGAEGLLGENFKELSVEFGEGVGKQMFDAEFDDIYNKIKSEGYLDNLIAAQYKGETVPKEFVDKVYSELTSHAKRFDPEINDDFFGYLNSQIANKAGNVYNREYKVDKTTAGRAQDIGETTQEGEVKVQVAAETDAALEALETEDLSIPGQARLKKEKAEKHSKFRRDLGFETGGEIYNKVLSAVKKSLLIAYRKTQNIKNPGERAAAIREILRQEYFTKGLTSDLFKPIKDFLGAKPYIKNLKKHREAIVNSISTADLVQMERKVADNERIFTTFVKKLTTKQEVQDAVNKNLLPPEALNKIDKGQAVNLYKKRMPTEAEFIAYADQPAVNPITGARSGLKGTRKDGFAKAIANTLALDAVMEVRQLEDVVDALDTDISDLMELSVAVGRDVDVKFSRSTAESQIDNAIDNNINVSAYSQIRFSRSHREQYEARLAKRRPDLSEKQIKNAVESVFKFVDGENIPTNKKAKYEKLAMHYMANGYLILPEDGYKVIEAERIATIKKIDPFSYKNPNELIEQFVGEVKGARTNPDTVKEFTNKKTLSNGVTVYDVEDSKEGQEAVRKVIDTHFGKKSNPWCLAARKGEYLYNDDVDMEDFATYEEAVAEKDRKIKEAEDKGNIAQAYETGDGYFEIIVTAKPEATDELKESFKHWQGYNKEGNGFKIAFRNGKLLCFRDGNDKKWWDRNDKSSDKIHFVLKEKKGNVESTYSVIPEDGTKILTKRVTGKMPNATVFQRIEYTGEIVESTTVFENGLEISREASTTHTNKQARVPSQLRGVNKMFIQDVVRDTESYNSKTNETTYTIEGTVSAMGMGVHELIELAGQKVVIEVVVNASTGYVVSQTINGKPVQNYITRAVKFSKSISEVNYNKAANNIKFSLSSDATRKKQQSYISKKADDARELGLTSEVLFWKTLSERIKEGASLREAYDVAHTEAFPGFEKSTSRLDENLIPDAKNIEVLEKNIKEFYLPQIREYAKKVIFRRYKKLIDSMPDNEYKFDIINNFLINFGRPIRSGKVLNITTNRKLLGEMKKAFGDIMNNYSLKEVQGGEKIMLNGKDIDLYQSITPIKIDPAKYVKKSIEQAKIARKWLNDILESDLSDGEKKALVQLGFYGQKGPGRKLSPIGFYVEGLRASEAVLEHEITADELHNAIIDRIDGKINDTELKEILDKARVHVLPKKIDDIMRAAGKNSKRNLEGYKGVQEAMDFLEKLYKKGKLKGDVSSLMFSKTKQHETVNNAILFSRSTKNKTKGITVLDFDDTLATSKSLIRFTRPDGTKGTLTPEQYAATYEDLADLGYVFDFSEFSKVVDGKPAPLLNKAKKLADKFGTKNIFVLTARPADSAPAIKQFLKENGLDIPLENITGLGNSTSEAKALWIADKVSEGYNDFYFADDALKNVQAVKNMLDQFDVKSKVQQAKVKFSKSLDAEFNNIIEDVTGIESRKRFSDIKARKRGASKGKFRFFIPPSHEDFVGLLYNFIGKGEKGNKHRNFFEQALVKPLNRAYKELDRAMQAIANDYKALNKQYPDIKKKLKKKTADGDFTFEDAIRVYIWTKNGHDIPGLSKKDQDMLNEYVDLDPILKAYANSVESISRVKGYIPPSESWDAGDIKVDLMDATGKVGRAQYFTEFVENSEEIFSKDNLNKIEAAYGKSVRESIEDMLYSIKTGERRPQGQNKIVNAFVNFINAAVGTVMFFNMRSSLLQQMSIVNYMNFADNNLFAMARAFADQKQYWADWAFIFNSDTLKQRRGGIRTDVNAAELVQVASKSKFPMRVVIQKLLALGFTPTQIGDSIAISTGGATYYRNRVNTYLKQGLSKKEAESKAFDDFNEITQQTQQSAREDMISAQQRSAVGKFVLSFQNVTSQFNRLGKKAFLDLKNRRITPPYNNQFQSDVSNFARITYYIGVQNMIFYSLQTALFMAMFDDEEEELTEKQEKSRAKKYEYAVNGAIDSVLRGTGVYGAIVATVKNMAIQWDKQREATFNKDESAVLVAALDVSPPLGIKARRIVSAEKTLNYNDKIIDHMELSDIDNPVWPAVTSYLELVNIPANKVYNKVQNLRQSLNKEHAALERVMMFFGWSQYNLDLENEKMKKIKQEVKDKNKKKKKKKKKSKFINLAD